jgi:2-dehydro-3-deoxyphosphooctonate aldolase (KDO 8-P synthase)
MSESPMLYIAGPCVLEDLDTAMRIAEPLAEHAARFPVSFVFKGSFDKANRTSLGAYRGPGLEKGLEILAGVKERLGVRVLSDVHETCQVAPAAEVLDILQIPAFLCRQTDLLVAAARTGRTVNIKKAQFASPEDMRHAVAKVEQSGNRDIWLTERGSCFGYNALVVDFRSFSMLRGLGHPVIFDATHAVQIPSLGGVSSGNREYVAPLARAAAAYGIDGLFTEVYPDPEKARCDGPNSLALADVPRLLGEVCAVRGVL